MHPTPLSPARYRGAFEGSPPCPSRWSPITGSALASRAARGLVSTPSAPPSPGSPRPRGSRSSLSSPRSRRGRALTPSNGAEGLPDQSRGQQRPIGTDAIVVVDLGFVGSVAPVRLFIHVVGGSPFE